MYCLLCKKFDVKHALNKRDVFANTPSTRYIEDSLKTHSLSYVHKSAIQTELSQKTSVFHKDVCTKAKVEVSLYEKVFWTVYFLMKSFISNNKLQPMLDHIEKVYDYNDLKFFDHKSAEVQREIFLTLGQTVKDLMIQQAKNASAYGLLTDEVSDISVTEHLITFIQFFDDKSEKVVTSFLSCQNILEDFASANAEAISKLILDSINSSGLEVTKFTGFSSDGASVMMGKKNGVAALLRLSCPHLINIHCICHKLALACTDTNENIKYIKTVELILRQLWNFFENSPKRMATYLKTQLALKEMDLSKSARSKVAKRLKKACRTRWLSLDSSVKAVSNDYEAILQTLTQMQEEDATALGLLKRMKTIKFLGVIYILKEVLPILSCLSKKFQRDSLSFSSIIPEVNATKEMLDKVLLDETPLNQLQSDIDSFTNMSAELTLNRNHLNEIQTLFRQYIDALKHNIDRRFGDSSEVVAAFCIFDPLAVPEGDGFKEYGLKEVEILGGHYHTDEEEIRTQLRSEWNSMKYHLKDILKPKVPQTIKEGRSKATSTEWCFTQLLSMPVYKQFFPRLTFIASVAASLPVTNAWPERGASALKNIKTRHRNRIKNDMLESLLQVAVNGPASSSEEAGKIVKAAVAKWLTVKDRRKLARKLKEKTRTQCALVTTEAGCQTEPVIIADQQEIREEILAAVKSLAMEGFREEDYESESDDDISDSDSEL